MLQMWQTLQWLMFFPEIENGRLVELKVKHCDFGPIEDLDSG